MEKDNWKKIIDAWEKSRKLQELKVKLKSRRMYTLSKKELEGMIESIVDCYILDNEDKEAFDWLDPEMLNVSVKDDIIRSLIQTLIKWNFYLIQYENTQDYEFCAKIRDVITVEINECIRIIESYYILEDGDFELIEELRTDARKTVEKNYEAWVNYLNENK